MLLCLSGSACETLTQQQLGFHVVWGSLLGVVIWCCLLFCFFKTWGMVRVFGKTMPSVLGFDMSFGGFCFVSVVCGAVAALAFVPSVQYG
jgi:hypothetical protein